MDEAALKADGWRLAHTTPLTQSFSFERFVGQRRVSTVTLRALTTEKAWAGLAHLVWLTKEARP